MKIKPIIIIFLIQFSVFSQTTETKTQNIFSVKAGLIGAWLSYEKALPNHYTIDTELGMAGGFIKHNGQKFKNIFTLEISVEPRYYYNFDKRVLKNKNINHNSSNYFSLDFNYVPDLLTLTNDNLTTIDKSINVVPKWGLKRYFNRNIGFELGIGLGYSFKFDSKNEPISGLDVKFCFN